ncbi:hypothetical protein ABDD95_00870 [Mucilaginibacter sp. PAMB04274]|uniref:hypothetical protein n=1 Tax=Mucilaginibacter sp. PAMB04274 TaxID=3138568 RepID=UPI0031F6A739
MLLGTTAHHGTAEGTETFILQLLLQQRYAEAYELLVKQPVQTAALYNTAICLHWSGDYQEALNRLEKIQLAPHMSSGNQLNTENICKQIRNKQNQTDDFLQGISEAYIKSFPALVHDAIIRLKTACWLQLGSYEKVIAIATPIAHKGYKNITDALKLADTAHDKRI